MEKARRKMKILILHRQCKRNLRAYECMYNQKVPNVKIGNKSTNGKHTSQGTYLERFLVDALCVFPPIARFCVRVEEISSPFSTNKAYISNRQYSVNRSTLLFQLRFYCRVFTFIDSLGSWRRRRRSSRSCDMVILSVSRRGKVPLHI